MGGGSKHENNVIKGILKQRYKVRLSDANNAMRFMYLYPLTTRANIIRMIEENGGAELSERLGMQVVIELVE